ncbi:LysR family transcriptional regulator [Agromyces archimandritae]|uniref:LysR family transcriptional regulator n=1 Tax=Agromyces archimandritae TaxID=2781962 RepID=A0A975FLZ3_9MICO|nr:LysR family transcriptional regulator [Agromyces archimandritae]QTX04364.1 LysR family transcriptional regulator [Agromyces archimandritae]
MPHDAIRDALDLATLRAVSALAEHGSLTAAAAAIGYSQPAISQRLQRFEARTGIALTERAGRGLRLTHAGRALLRHAVAVRGELDAAAAALAELGGLEAGRIRLAAFPSASATLVPALVRILAARHPGLAVSYVEAEPPEAVAAVRDDRADLAITFSYPGDRHDPHRDSARGLDVADYAEEEVRLVLPAGHPAADAGRAAGAGDPAGAVGTGASAALPALAELAGEDWIAGCPRCRGHLLEVCGVAGFEPRIVFETDNAAAVEGMVAEGLGVALLPELALAASARRPGVVTRATGERRTLHLVTARGAAPAVAAARRALAEVRERAGRGAGASTPEGSVG